MPELPQDDQTAGHLDHGVQTEPDQRDRAGDDPGRHGDHGLDRVVGHARPRQQLRPPQVPGQLYHPMLPQGQMLQDRQPGRVGEAAEQAHRCRRVVQFAGSVGWVDLLSHRHRPMIAPLTEYRCGGYSPPSPRASLVARTASSCRCALTPGELCCDRCGKAPTALLTRPNTRSAPSRLVTANVARPPPGSHSLNPPPGPRTPAPVVLILLPGRLLRVAAARGPGARVAGDTDTSPERRPDQILE